MTPETISRAAAKALGLVRYFTGKACKHSHIAPRYASTGQCSACVDESKKQHGVKSERAKLGASRRNKRWGDKNRERKAATSLRWRQARPEAVRAHVLNRRALRTTATPPWFGEMDELVMTEASDLARMREAVTGLPWHVDHMLPLRGRGVTGLHVAGNVQVIPAAMNVAKGNKLQLTEVGQWLRAI